MMFSRLAAAYGTMIAASVSSAAMAAPPALSPERCELGAYRSAQGGLLAITAPSTGGTRYTFLDGRRGLLSDADAMFTCRGSELHTRSGALDGWTKVRLRLTHTTFTSKGVPLRGLLIEPPTSETASKPPLVVMAHGSENFGWLPGAQATPFLTAAQGVSTFIFDKRGTGGSGGTFHMNFRGLADDLVAASSEAKRLAYGRYSRFGLHGGSQGGWTVPLAAKGAAADFMVVSFGGVFSPEEEDSEQVLDELRDAGYGADILTKAKEVTRATGEVVASEYQRGFAELARVKAAYGQEPWFAKIEGEYSGEVLRAVEADLRRRINRSRIDWRHDALAVIRENLSVPTLWILAGDDREAPGRLTEDRLAMLTREGKPITVAVFPDTDHGMVEYTTSADGTRKATRVTNGYHQLLADWMRGLHRPPYGRATFSGAPPVR